MRRSERVVWTACALLLTGACAVPMSVAGAQVAQGLTADNGPRVTVRAELEDFSGTRRIRARFRVDGDAYVVVGQIGADGVLRIIYPESPGASGFVKGGSSYTTPDAFAGFSDAYRYRLSDYRFQPSSASSDSYDGGLGWLFVIASWKPLRTEQFSDNGRWSSDELSDQEYLTDPRPAVYDLASTLAAGPDEPYTVQFAKYYNTMATDAGLGFENGYAAAACGGFMGSPIGFSYGFEYPMFFYSGTPWRRYGWSGLGYLGMMPGCYPGAFGIGYTIASGYGYGYPFGYGYGGYPYGYRGYGYGYGYGGWWNPPVAPAGPQRPGFSPYLGITHPVPHRQNGEFTMPLGAHDIGAGSHFSPGGRVALPGSENAPSVRPDGRNRMPLEQIINRRAADAHPEGAMPSPRAEPVEQAPPVVRERPQIERPQIEPRQMAPRAPRVEPRVEPREIPREPTYEPPRMSAPPPRMSAPPPAPRMSPPPRMSAPPPPPRPSSGGNPHKP